jgi:TatD DNase family protein
MLTKQQWRVGRAVRQRSAKPSRWVRLPYLPPITNYDLGHFFVCLKFLLGLNLDYMKIHDTHAHLDYLLKRDPNLDIELMIGSHEFWIQPGVNVERDSYCLKEYMKYPNMYFMIGAHPGEVRDSWDLDEYISKQSALIDLYQHEIGNKIIAIGEIGLDYTPQTTTETKNQQKTLFDYQIKLAKKLNLPFVIHCRDAFEDVFKIIEQNLPLTKPFLVHCFTGGVEEYNKVVELGGYVAFGGIITYNNTQNLNEALLIADKYVIETDLPWLAPQPNRGKLNLPEYINLIIEYIANKKNTTIDQVVKTSKLNSQTIFDKKF